MCSPPPWHRPIGRTRAGTEDGISGSGPPFRLAASDPDAQNHTLNRNSTAFRYRTTSVATASIHSAMRVAQRRRSPRLQCEERRVRATLGRLSVMSIEFKFETSTSTGRKAVNLPAAGVVCIVGGNNVRKSQLHRPTLHCSRAPRCTGRASVVRQASS